MGGFKNVANCRKTPANVRDELKALHEEKRQQKEIALGGSGGASYSVDEFDMQEDEDELEIIPTGVRKRIPSGQSSTKKMRGGMDAFVTSQGKGKDEVISLPFFYLFLDFSYGIY